MNAITPENEIPPAQSTAASGTFPIEQTNERIATIGPTTTFSSSCTPAGASVRKRLLNTPIGSSATKPAIRKPTRDLLPEHLEVAAEVVRDVRPGGHRREPLAPAALADRALVLVARVGRLRVARASSSSRLLTSSRSAEPDERDQHDPADELGQRELPAEEDPEHDPELEDEVRRRELEGHRRGEARALLEHRLRDRDRRVAARRRGRAEPGRERRSCAGRAPPRALCIRDARHPGLHHRREQEAEHERPADLPRHLARVRQPLSDQVEDMHTPGG